MPVRLPLACTIALLLACTAAVDWQPVADLIDAFSQVPDCYVAVHDRSTTAPLYSYAKGSAAPLPGDSIQFASASKWLSGSVIMRLVQDGKLSLDDRPQDHLSWWTSNTSDARARITLRHLLTFTSGLGAGFAGVAADDACTGNGGVTMEACAQTIYAANNPPLTEPGTAFQYGSNHFQIAAVMALYADGRAPTGSGWSALFRDTVLDPLGIGGGNLYTPVNNPNTAGGFFGKVSSYEQWLRSIYLADGVVLDQATVTALEAPPPSVAIEYTPAPSFFYGLAHWLECPMGFASFNATCLALNRHSSLGAWGFYPWISRQHDYYAILSVFNTAPLSAVYSGLLGAQIMPEIERILAELRGAAASTAGPSSTTGPGPSCLPLCERSCLYVKPSAAPAPSSPSPNATGIPSPGTPLYTVITVTYPVAPGETVDCCLLNAILPADQVGLWFLCDESSSKLRAPRLDVKAGELSISIYAIAGEDPGEVTDLDAAAAASALATDRAHCYNASKDHVCDVTVELAMKLKDAWGAAAAAHAAVWLVAVALVLAS